MDNQSGKFNSFHIQPNSGQTDTQKQRVRDRAEEIEEREREKNASRIEKKYCNVRNKPFSVQRTNRYSGAVTADLISAVFRRYGDRICTTTIAAPTPIVIILVISSSIMEISEPTIIVYYSSRILGFAPYSLKRNKLHQITEIKFNVFLCAYSVLILSSLIGLTIYGLVHDTNSKLPLR